MRGASTTEITTGVPTLVRLSSSQQHQPIRLDGMLTVIGSKPGAAIHLQSRAVSGAHAVLINLDNVVYLRDLCSRSGVFVNDKPAREARLLHGDVIRIGAFRFRFSDVAVLRRSRDGLKTPPALLRVPGAPEPVTVHNRVFLIGRRDGADLVLPNDKQVSSAHAMLLDVGGQRVLCDLHSRYGTTVNGSRVTTRELTPGDTIQIGNAALEYHTDAAAIAAARSTDGGSSRVLQGLTERPEQPVTIVPPAPAMTQRMGGNAQLTGRMAIASPEVLAKVDDAPLAQSAEPAMAPPPQSVVPPKRQRADDQSMPPRLKRANELLEARASDLFSDLVVNPADVHRDDELSDPSGSQQTAMVQAQAASSADAIVPTQDNVPLHDLTLQADPSALPEFDVHDALAFSTEDEVEHPLILEGWELPAADAAGDEMREQQPDAEPLPIGALPVDDISSGLFAETNTELSLFLDDHVQDEAAPASAAGSASASSTKPTARARAAARPRRRLLIAAAVAAIFLLMAAAAAMALWLLPGLRARFM